MPDDSPRLYALRGATTVERDTSADIAERTAELLGVVLDRNDVAIDDIVSVILSATPDLRADFPAVAARSIGLSHTPLLCCQEIPVEGAVERCVRVLLHVYLPTGSDVHHVYLHGARQLRLDLPE
ncbi:MAG: chorismate mutase [Actinobacteria bacterium]|nr:chorismate mutase [Actinomycetota bacterium]